MSQTEPEPIYFARATLVDGANPKEVIATLNSLDGIDFARQSILPIPKCRSKDKPGKLVDWSVDFVISKLSAIPSVSDLEDISMLCELHEGKAEHQTFWDRLGYKIIYYLDKWSGAKLRLFVARMDLKMTENLKMTDLEEKMLAKLLSWEWLHDSWGPVSEKQLDAYLDSILKEFKIANLDTERRQRILKTMTDHFDKLDNQSNV